MIEVYQGEIFSPSSDAKAGITKRTSINKNAAVKQRHVKR